MGDSDRPQIASLTAAVYLIDTSSSWRMAGLIDPRCMPQMQEQVRQGSLDADRITMAASWCILDHCKPDPEPSQAIPDEAKVANQVANRAIELAVAALVQTRCYELAKSGPTGLNGHWLYLVYRMRDGTAIARPAMLPARQIGLSLLEPATLESCIERIIEADTSASLATSSIARRLHECGGAILPGSLATEPNAAAQGIRPRPLS